MKKTTRNLTIVGRTFAIALIVIGVIIGKLYLDKYFPFDPVKHFALLAVWSSFGWIFAGIPIFSGICILLFEGDSK